MEELSTPRRALFVDLDGTVRNTKTGRVHPIVPEDQVLRPHVLDTLRAYRDSGYAVVGATNQGGVAFGTLTEDDVREINQYLADVLAPHTFDLVLYCPYHRHGRVEEYRAAATCRKPLPGMAYEARDRLNLDLARSIMVGDLDTDRQFAENAGIGQFFWERDFFGVIGPEPPEEHQPDL